LAARFWKSQPVSGAIVSVASPPHVRLTVSSTTGMTTGDTRTVFGIVGTTEANGTWVITVIDATHIDLQGTTFANVYTSGGSVNGRWDAANTNNWVTSTGGTNYGQTVPGSADTVTLDGSSGGGTVTVNTTVTVQSMTWGTFTGTLDFSANNNNVTLSAAGTGFSGTGSGTRTINLGNGTWTLSGTTAGATAWNMSTTTNLTFNANSSTLVFSGVVATDGLRTFSGGGLTYNAIQLGAQANGGGTSFAGANTIANLAVTGPNVVELAATQTVATLAINGTSSGPILVRSSVDGVSRTLSVASNAPTIAYAALRDITGAGGASFVASNSFDFGNNTGITINGPSGGGMIASRLQLGM
jgi:hypothetical protein